MVARHAEGSPASVTSVIIGRNSGVRRRESDREEHRPKRVSLSEWTGGESPADRRAENERLNRRKQVEFGWGRLARRAAMSPKACGP